MYISRVRITNYRCFRDTSIDFVPGVNVIIGENNSGKSALLRALGLVFAGSSRARMHLFDFNQAISEFTEPPVITVTVTLRSEGEGADGMDDLALVASWLVRHNSPSDLPSRTRMLPPSRHISRLQNQQTPSGRQLSVSFRNTCHGSTEANLTRRFVLNRSI